MKYSITNNQSEAIKQKYYSTGYRGAMISWINDTFNISYRGMYNSYYLEGDEKNIMWFLLQL